MGCDDLLTFIKYHALGNDYLFLDSLKFQHPSTELTKMVCHRNFGIGSDGILYGGKSNDGSFNLEIINPDGSVAEISGNGARIFSRAMFDMGHVVANSAFIIKTSKMSVTATVARKELISVNMGTPSFDDKILPNFPEKFGEIDVDEKHFKYYPVSVGNPHCVIFQNKVTKEMAMTYGPHLENNSLYPQKTNVQFAHVVDANNIEVEIWERGAGYTLASGSSACAVFAVASRLSLCSDNVTVHMPGGDLNVEMSAAGEIVQTGPVKRIATCVIDEDFLLN